ncbi:hypothetical protein K504DRAFT_284056 [Pleomassaria siparia CBS 279.74]|uniref:Uncharacterized protein n=1 Tax=Pleomassaria siparia CBS 279.74 TaxID=1314801 RepID=A0A6G1KBL0_9PLEO|nr:hypothetical protein K504DRAFT_284056 [Pleomassaria siparia CBS 279.74]
MAGGPNATTQTRLNAHPCLKDLIITPHNLHARRSWTPVEGSLLHITCHGCRWGITSVSPFLSMVLASVIISLSPSPSIILPWPMYIHTYEIISRLCSLGLCVDRRSFREVCAPQLPSCQFASLARILPVFSSLRDWLQGAEVDGVSMNCPFGKCPRCPC